MDHAFLSRTPLFRGFSEAEIEELLDSIKGRSRCFSKGEVIYHAGTLVTSLALVLSGSVNIVIDYYWGSSNIFSHIKAGGIFAESYAALGKELAVDVVAAEECKILFMDAKLLSRSRAVHNLLDISAEKNIALSRRMMHTAPKTIRQRLLSYLSQEAMQAGSECFTIPFSRQQLADYLNVDRSALSAELQKMQRDGLIELDRNTFHLLSREVIT